MRDDVRALRLLIGTAFRVAPGRVAVALLETLGSSLTALNALWAGLLVGAALTRNLGQATLAVVALVVSASAQWALGLSGAEARVTLAERVSFSLDRHIATTTSSIPTLTHLERADFADQVQVLRQNRGILGGGLSSMMYNLDYLLTAVITLIMAAAIDPRLLLVVLTAVPPLLGARLRYRWAEQAEDESAEPGRLVQHLMGATTNADLGMEIRVFGLRAEIIRRLNAAILQWRRPLLRETRRATNLRLGEDVFFALVLTALLAWLVLSAAPGAASSIAVAVVAARQIQTVIVQAVHGFSGEGGFTDTVRTLRRVLWLDDYTATEQARHTGSEPAPTELVRGIELRDVGFRYHGSERPSLEAVNVTIPAGSIVGVVGENGAGKTTLAKLLTGMYRPSMGSIMIDGVPLDDLDLEDWRRQTTAAFQDHVRFEFTVQEAIGVGHLSEVDDRSSVLAASDRSGATALVNSLPDQLDTQLGSQWEKGINLSGGQWQTIALARAMMRTQPILQVLDEPTAALDAEAEHRLFLRYADAARASRDHGAITLLATHRFTTIQAADLILVLHDGHLIEHGTHQELMESRGHYFDLYTLQADSYGDS